MNLMEITKGYKPKQNEQMDQTMYSLDTTDKWRQLAKEQAETLEKVTAERDELQVRNQKMNEFIQEFQERLHKLKMEKQKLFFENHEMQEEMQKSNAEIRQMTAELSEMRKFNQLLQQSNDDLRNRNGLMSRSEQEQLEEEIKDVRDRNSKLQIQVKQSSVDAVVQAQQKQEEAEKQASQAKFQTEKEKKRADVEIQIARRKAKAEIEDMKEKQLFWDWGYITVIVFSILQNGAFQRDILQLIILPINWCREYATWFEQLDYRGYSLGEVAFERIFSMAVIMAGIVGCVFLVWGGIEQYRKIWDDIYKMVLIASISFVAVLGNVIREIIPINLVISICIINVGTILLREYLKKKYSLINIY